MSASKGSANSTSTPRSASSRDLVRRGVRRKHSGRSGAFLTKSPEIFLRMRLEAQHRQRLRLSLQPGAWLPRSGRDGPDARRRNCRSPPRRRADRRARPRNGVRSATPNPWKAGRRGTSTRASDSSTSRSPTLQTQSRTASRPPTSRTVTVVMTSSPIRTGDLNTMEAETKIVPSPGSWVPITAEMNPMLSTPCATRPRNSVLRAYSSSKCTGFMSPVASPKSWT